MSIVNLQLTIDNSTFMNPGLEQAVVLITSSDPENSNFGTGFIIYRDEHATVVLTCLHVIRDVGGADCVKIGNSHATLIAAGSEESADDIAVLRIAEVLDRQPLPLSDCGVQGLAFMTIGYSLYDKRHGRFRLERLQGVLDKEVWLTSREQTMGTQAWVLRMDQDSRLQRGYSGSPVLDKQNGVVLGVASYKEGQGEAGLAISIGVLKNIWPEIPFEFLPPSQAQQPVASGREPVITSSNPFGDRGRITDPQRFFDREELLRRIFEELHKGVNISLVGGSAVGKSSILSILCEKGPTSETRKRFLQLAGVNFVYCNMELIENEDELYDALCDELGISSCRGYKLTRALRGKRYVLCLDEIEKMAWEGFTVRVRSHLRGLADGPDAPLKLVIVSRSPLSHLFPDSPELDSPLAGICRQLDVKPFSPEVARNFLCERLAGTGIRFTEEQISELIYKTTGHPAKLQEEAAKLFRELTR